MAPLPDMGERGHVFWGLQNPRRPYRVEAGPGDGRKGHLEWTECNSRFDSASSPR